MTRAAFALAWLLALPAVYAGAEFRDGHGPWFDGSAGGPKVPTAARFGKGRAAPVKEHALGADQPPPADLAAASGRWSNRVQGARIAQPASGKPLKIAVIGDSERGRFFWERIFSPGKDAYARQIKAIHALAPDLIVQLGDFVSEGTIEQYRGQVAFLDKNVSIPYLSVIGNHDRSRPNGNADKRLYETVFGPGDYFVDLGDWRLILLDSSNRAVTKAQIDWLASVLDVPKRSLIFTHVPPAYLKPAFGDAAEEGPDGQTLDWDGGWRDQAREYLGLGLGRALDSDSWIAHKIAGNEGGRARAEKYEPFKAYFDRGSREFGELVARHKVARVYMGHIHAFATARRDGVSYVLTGGGGSPLYPLPPGYPESMFAHFIEAELSPAGVRDVIHPLNGKPSGL